MAKITKVELSWDDGTVSYLEKEQAEQWYEACNAQSTYCYAHNVLFPPLVWKHRRIFTEVSPGLFVGEKITSVFAKKDDEK